MNTTNQILTFLLAEGMTLSWKQIEGQPCIHSSNGDFHFTLCRYYPNGMETMFLDVDDIKNRTGNILKENYSKGHPEFYTLLELYQFADANSQLIRA